VAFHLTALAAGEAVSRFCARQAPGRTSSSCPTSSEARGAEARGPCRRRQTRQVSACRRVRAPEFSESGAALAQPSSVSPGGHSPATVRPPDRHATVERASPLRSVLEHGRSIRNRWESRNCDGRAVIARRVWSRETDAPRSRDGSRDFAQTTRSPTDVVVRGPPIAHHPEGAASDIEQRETQTTYKRNLNRRCCGPGPRRSTNKGRNACESLDWPLRSVCWLCQGTPYRRPPAVPRRRRTAPGRSKVSGGESSQGGS
jgi:hypothetical protein